MLTPAVAFLVAFTVAVCTTPIARTLARRLGAMDSLSSSRKIHARAVPRMGGLAIAAGFYAPLVALLVYRNPTSLIFYASPRAVLGLGIGGLAILALGVYDDLHGANAWQKLAVQIGVAVAMVFCGYRIDVVGTPFGFAIPLGVASVPLTVLWIVGLINAMNLIDGLDGLASGVAFFAIATCFVISYVQANVLMVLCGAALAGALLGFLFFNFNPATIFMGDTGSMFLGFVLATTAIRANQKSSTAVAIFVPLLALGLPIMDTALAMIRRLLWSRPVFSADKDHIHHRLLALGFTHRRAVLFLYGVCGLFALSGLALTFANSRQAALILAVVVLIVIGLVRLLGYVNLSGDAVHRLVLTRRRNREMRARLAEVQEILRQVTKLDDLWPPVRELLGALGAQEARLLVQDDPERSHKMFTWRADTPVEGALASTRIALNQLGHGVGEIEFGWKPPVDRDSEIASELLAAHLSDALHRLLAVSAAAVARDAKVIPLPRKK